MASNIAIFTKLKQIKRVDSSTGRYYNSPAFPSFSTVIRRFQETPYLDKWVKNVGEFAAAEKGKNAAARGTRVHAALVKAFKGEKYNLTADDLKFFHNIVPVIVDVKPLMMEQPIIWQKNPVTDPYGFGGTPDILGELDLSLLYKANKNKVAIVPNTTRLLMDYKTWAKPKYGASLLPTCMQLAAYCAGINQCTNSHPNFQVNEGLIIAATPTNLYLYYLDSEKINWYWTQFKIMLEAYHDKSAATHFNWKSFEFAAQDLSKINNKYIKGIDNRLPERVYLSHQLDSIRQPNNNNTTAKPITKPKTPVKPKAKL
jgi:hypothetical protein